MTGNAEMPAARIYWLLDRVVSLIELVFIVIAACFLIAIMLFVSADVLLRYLFNAPLSFQYTLTESYLLVGLVLMSLSWGFRTGGYIRITFLSALLPQRASELLLRAGLLASAVYIGVLAWTSFGHFVDVYQSGDVKFGVIDWPVYLSWIWVPLGCGLLCCRLLLTTFGPAAQLHFEHEGIEGT